MDIKKSLQQKESHTKKCITNEITTKSTTQTPERFVTGLNILSDSYVNIIFMFHLNKGFVTPIFFPSH